VAVEDFDNEAADHLLTPVYALHQGIVSGGMKAFVEGSG
jgi:hypothetical protein